MLLLVWGSVSCHKQVQDRCMKHASFAMPAAVISLPRIACTRCLGSSHTSTNVLMLTSHNPCVCFAAVQFQGQHPLRDRARKIGEGILIIRSVRCSTRHQHGCNRVQQHRRSSSSS